MTTEVESRLSEAFHADAQRARLLHPDAPPTSAPSSLSQTHHRATQRGWLLAAAAATLLVVAGVALIQNARGGSPAPTAPSLTVAPPSTPTAPMPTAPVSSTAATPPPMTVPGGPPRVDGSSFAAAVEASGVLANAPADDVTQVTGGGLWNDNQIQITATGNYLRLMCRDAVEGTCAGAAYVTATADGAAVHAGLLSEGAARHGLDLYAVDDRYFVVSERSVEAPAPSRAWLVDAESGRSGALIWRDEPTSLDTPEEALLLCQRSPFWDCGIGTDASLPRVVDGRDGTIRPLTVPDDAVGLASVAQHGDGRIWVATHSADDRFGVAASDDGGATWSSAALPEGVGATREDPDLAIAADGDRVAVGVWGYNVDDTVGDEVYVSDDAGQTWTTATISVPHHGAVNSVSLYVLADRRLALMWYVDGSAQQLLASTTSDWLVLDKIDAPFRDSTGSKPFTVNGAGIAMIRTGPGATGISYTNNLGADLATWLTIAPP